MAPGAIIDIPVLGHIKHVPPVDAVFILPAAIGQGMSKFIEFFSPITQRPPGHGHDPGKPVAMVYTIHIEQF